MNFVLLILRKKKRISLFIYTLKTSFGKTILAIDIIDNSSCREQALHLLVRCPTHPEAARRLLTLYNFLAFFRHDGGSVSRNANVDSKPQLRQPSKRETFSRKSRSQILRATSVARIRSTSLVRRDHENPARNWMSDRVRNKRTHDRDFSNVTYIPKLCELNPRKSRTRDSTE